ncbi:unnamed protein product [Oikopleura dioica]|uniref:Peptidase S1 domain-containing protein n=1 Tax=Oikopleura dioica TaxID=34765 RepID=E4Y610_OIKDI|nr:unnamed protein product [Oikopleura dioica]
MFFWNTENLRIKKYSRVVEIINHPDYKPDPIFYVNDINLLLLKEAFEITDYVRPACLPQLSEYIPENGVACVASGFGQEGICDENVRFFPTRLKSVVLEIVDNEICAEKNGFDIDNSRLCAAGFQNGRDTCDGDSGGPLLCDVEGRWTLTGVVSFGLDYGEKEMPDQVSTTTTTTTTTTELTPIDPSEVSILVILSDLSASYLTSGDGSSKVAAKISAPSNGYTRYAKHALVNGQVHIFGGNTDKKKIAKLNGCAFTQLSARLNVDRDSSTEALSIQSGSQALICFNYAQSSKSCEIFDGSSAVTTFETTNTHQLGGLGFYQNQPATVGSYWDNHKKAETLTSTGWVALPDHPEALYGHSSIGLDDDSMMLLGGYIFESRYETGIWKIKENIWSRIGELTQSAGLGSAIYTGRSIYNFSGYSSPFPNHRIDLTADEEIKEVVRIANHERQYNYPVLLVTENNRCL